MVSDCGSASRSSSRFAKSSRNFSAACQNYGAAGHRAALRHLGNTPLRCARVEQKGCCVIANDGETMREFPGKKSLFARTRNVVDVRETDVRNEKSANSAS